MGTFLIFTASLFGATQLPPIDECAVDPSFVAFRSGLLATAERRDVEALVGALDDKVLVDFGGGEGEAAFRSTWGLDSPHSSKIWNELKEVLSLGCALRDGTALAPSFSAQLDPDADLFESALAVHPGAIVRDKYGKTLGKLNWELLSLTEFPEQGAARIKLTDGREGYVAVEDVRSPGDYRITMAKHGGTWRITAFVAGD